MQRAIATLLLASACTASMPPLRSTVTVARTTNVVLIVDDLDADLVRACSAACPDAACAAACPTAVASPGPCRAADTTHAVCRTFVDEETFERGGGCKAVDEAPGVHRTACVDNVAERKARARAVKRKVNVVAGIILIPVAVLVVILLLI